MAPQGPLHIRTHVHCIPTTARMLIPWHRRISHVSTTYLCKALPSPIPIILCCVNGDTAHHISFTLNLPRVRKSYTLLYSVVYSEEKLQSHFNFVFIVFVALSAQYTPGILDKLMVKIQTFCFLIHRKTVRIRKSKALGTSNTHKIWLYNEFSLSQRYMRYSCLACFSMAKLSVIHKNHRSAVQSPKAL